MIILYFLLAGIALVGLFFAWVADLPPRNARRYWRAVAVAGLALAGDIAILAVAATS